MRTRIVDVSHKVIIYPYCGGYYVFLQPLCVCAKPLVDFVNVVVVFVQSVLMVVIYIYTLFFSHFSLSLFYSHITISWHSYYSFTHARWTPLGYDYFSPLFVLVIDVTFWHCNNPNWIFDYSKDDFMKCANICILCYGYGYGSLYECIFWAFAPNSERELKPNQTNQMHTIYIV